MWDETDLTKPHPGFYCQEQNVPRPVLKYGSECCGLKTWPGRYPSGRQCQVYEPGHAVEHAGFIYVKVGVVTGANNAPGPVAGTEKKIAGRYFLTE